MIKEGVKRGHCWYRGCNEKYVLAINLKFIEHGKFREESEFRACKTHFKEFWERPGQFNYTIRIEEYLK